MNLKLFEPTGIVMDSIIAALPIVKWIGGEFGQRVEIFDRKDHGY